MNYYFDLVTGGPVSTFELIFTLTPPAGLNRLYSQTLTFSDISSDVLLETLPPNIIGPLGKTTTNPLP
jgi:hypothetical protein